MKREEMLELITQEIWDILDVDYRSRAEAILVTIEKAGMLPPPVDLPIMYHSTSGKQLKTEKILKWED